MAMPPREAQAARMTAKPIRRRRLLAVPRPYSHSGVPSLLAEWLVLALQAACGTRRR